MITGEDFCHMLEELIYNKLPTIWATRVCHVKRDNGVDQFSIFVGSRQQDVEDEADKVLSRETGK